MDEKQAAECEVSTSGTVTVQGVALKSVEDVREADLDPRISVSTHPTGTELDQSFVQKVARSLHPSKHQTVDQEHQREEPEPIYVEFEDGDTRNPVNFPRSKKWAITLLACFSTMLASLAAGSYNQGFPSMTRDLNCTSFQATVGLSLYALGFGVIPLFTASFSEEFGRYPLYLFSAVGFLLMYLAVALAQNIQTVLIARFLQGSFGSTGATMVGGTIADIWTPQERGLPMCIFAVVALGFTGVGPMFAGWVEMNSNLQWRWIQWIQMIICAIYLVLVPLIIRETRSSIILRRLAKRIRKETGDNRYRARIEEEHVSLLKLMHVACTRPIHLLVTEPVVASFSLWIGFAWGVLYCMIESISAIFRDIYGFNAGQTGSVYATMLKNFASRGPEARLYFACIAGIGIPSGMFIYAWTSFPSVPWIAPAIGITVFVWAAFTVYLAVFTYLADCYGPFASSALAGQSLCRNLSATAFPLFTQQMFNTLSYKWANTMFGCISLMMMPIPFDRLHRFSFSMGRKSVVAVDFREWLWNRSVNLNSVYGHIDTATTFWDFAVLKADLDRLGFTFKIDLNLAAPMAEAVKQAFFKSSTFAVVGASKDQTKFGTKVLKWYQERKLDVTPVHPVSTPSIYSQVQPTIPLLKKESELEGIAAIKSIEELPSPSTTSISVITPARVTLDVLKKAKELSVPTLWLQPGAEDAEVVAYIKDNLGDRVVYGGPCILVEGDVMRARSQL
ncbi:hypothetical protein D9758_006075 [Tetrapyrgos nigripes]|uniref:Major facilitator superfamily (MFS) profile domain-containing protein n=1 Tax=Tetrapyrgos nigripes TaxID=182062 RepID=A0A8H5D9W5_9AGAR|nr:hypothetical protein D9758_006075 [Tetrapyrgos nigripes]